jgi:hypothetical protein
MRRGHNRQILRLMPPGGRQSTDPRPPRTLSTAGELMHTMAQRIFGGALAAVIAIAAAVCPCKSVAASAQPTGAAHACCRAKRAAPTHSDRADHRCGHCDGQRILATNSSKAAAATLTPPLAVDWLAPQAMSPVAGPFVPVAISTGSLPSNRVAGDSLLALHCALTL